MIAIMLNLLVRDRQSTSSFTPRKSIGQIALLLRIPWLENPSDEPLPPMMEMEKQRFIGSGPTGGSILVRVKIQKSPGTLDCGSLGNTVSCDNSIYKSLEKDYSEADTRELK
jgi:hypothetical protein